MIGRLSPRRMLSASILGPAMICALLLGFSLLSPGMASRDNILNILAQASYLMLFAPAQSMVLLVRGYDLSLGNAVSLVSVIVALAMTSSWAQTAGWPVLLSVLCGLGVALTIGIANGVLVAKAGLNPFIVTLAMTYVLIAISSTVTGGVPVSGLPKSFVTLSNCDLLGLPLQIWTLGAATLLLYAALEWTVFGRSLYLIGSNPLAATAAGIPTRLVTALAYVLCSIIAGVGAILLTARTGSGEPTLSANLTLEAIAAAVVGGMSTQGGKGAASAPLIGAVLITLLSNGMNMARIDGYIQQICLGLIILAALALDRLRTR
jgi:ribose transport system permease protein